MGMRERMCCRNRSEGIEVERREAKEEKRRISRGKGSGEASERAMKEEERRFESEKICRSNEGIKAGSL